MSQDIQRHFKADMAAIPTEEVSALEGAARAKSMVAHTLLRVWTRLALDTGHKLRMSPSQYQIGTYKGKMNWLLNEGGLNDVKRVAVLGSHGKEYALVGEVYELEGVVRARMLFSFQEDEVRGKPVFVSYLLYDENAGDFDISALTDAMAPAMPKWVETIYSKSEEPLWNYSKEHFECVGM